MLPNKTVNGIPWICGQNPVYFIPLRVTRIGVRAAWLLVMLRFRLPCALCQKTVHRANSIGVTLKFQFVLCEQLVLQYLGLTGIMFDGIWFSDDQTDVQLDLIGERNLRKLSSYELSSGVPWPYQASNRVTAAESWPACEAGGAPSHANR